MNRSGFTVSYANVILNMSGILSFQTLLCGLCIICPCDNGDGIFRGYNLYWNHNIEIFKRAQSGVPCRFVCVCPACNRYAMWTNNHTQHNSRPLPPCPQSVHSPVPFSALHGDEVRRHLLPPGLLPPHGLSLLGQSYEHFPAIFSPPCRGVRVEVVF